MFSSFIESLQRDLQTYQGGNDEKLSFRVSRQLSRIRKKMRFNDSDLEQAALTKFIDLNQIVGNSTLDLSTCPNICEAREYIYNSLCSVNRRYCSVGQMTFLPELFYKLWRLGPGASNGVRGSHFCDKIEGVWTCTSRAFRFAQQLRSLNPHLKLHDVVVILRAEDECKDHFRDSWCSIVEGSKLGTVPKNQDTYRTIAIEPVGNMALQLAAGRYLEGVLQSRGLDITKQADLNNRLACDGSIFGHLATIDLSNASDMISPALVKALFPSDWYSLFMAIRSPVTNIPGHGEVTLNMISTMGNGFTFPLMTLIIHSLCYSIARQHNEVGHMKWLNPERWGVFGDDIICPVEHFDSVVQGLEQWGLVVNTDKSYSFGPFRESCGGDYFMGVDVTPFYPKSLASDAEIYIVINQLLKWAAKDRLPVFRSLSFLISLLSEKVLLVPEWEDAFAGIRTAGCPKRYRKLSLEKKSRRYHKNRRDKSFLYRMCIVGGYVESNRRFDSNGFLIGEEPSYTPRCRKARFNVTKSRLPKGFLDGRDIEYMSRRESSWCDFLIEAALM